ncbi:hypothetical protein I4U23_011484 [Adineta vaga]|nr:hypothetical protein I4U23_011484 [Adineta vaga]
MEQIWNKNLQQLLPIEHEITFKNAGKAAATLNYRRIVSAQDMRKPLTAKLHMEPDNLVIAPNSQVPVRFIYYPTDLQKFDARIQIQTNTSIDPISVPYSIEFHTPKLQSMPRNLINVGLLESDKFVKDKVLMIKNIGEKELRFVISEPRRKHSAIKTAFLQESSSPASLSINQPLRINPNQYRSFDLKIEYNQIDTSLESEIIELAEFELTSLCDPVIDMNSTLTNRMITIVIVGHTKPLVEYALPKEGNSNDWSTLDLLPSSWLYHIYREHTNHTSYIPLIMLTAIAHVCGSQKTKNSSLPITSQEWSTFCSNLHLGGSRSYQEKLEIGSFNDQTTISTATDTLIKYLRLSCTTNRSFFYYSSLFHRSFTNYETIRLQLIGVNNSAANIDEAYTMQEYVEKFWNIYEECSIENVYAQTIEFIHQCISNDCNMPESIRSFTKFIHQIVQPSSTVSIEQQLLKLIPSTNTLIELIQSSTNLFDLKWTLLFTHINERTRAMLIRLVKTDWQALLDLHLMIVKQQNSYTIQRSLLEAVKNMHSLWNTMDMNVKSNIFTSLFDNFKEFLSILTSVLGKQRLQFSDLMQLTKQVVERYEPSQSFKPIENFFVESKSYGISNALRNIPCLPKPPPQRLIVEIYNFQRTLTGDFRNSSIRIEHIKPYCDILNQLLSLTASQWNSVKKVIESACLLLCDLHEKDKTVGHIFAQILLLLNVLNPERNWYSIRELYKQLYSTPTWETMLSFADTLGCHQDVIRLTETLENDQTEENKAETILQLYRLVSTDDERELLNTNESLIRQLSSQTSTSPIDFFEQVRQFTPLELQPKIHAYLVLQHLSSYTTSDDEDQYLLFDNIVPSWLTLFDINCKKLHRLFSTISSILTSIPGLLVTKNIPLCQQLYTTNLTSALCILARCRQNAREEFVINPSNSSSIKLPSMLMTIRESLTKSINTQQTSTVTVQPPPPTTTTTPSSAPPTLTRMRSIICPYSEETLANMEASVLNYVKHLKQPSNSFAESDTIHHIIDTTLNTTLSKITQWYATFTTFNVLVHYRSNSNNSQDIQAGHDIVQHGLHLLRNLVIVRKILEPNFAHVGVQFLIKELTQVEKCLLSLSLEKYPIMRNTLRQLNIDISRIKLDFNLPSQSVTPKGKSSSNFKLDILPQISTPSESIAQNSTSMPLINMNENNDPSISFDDWQNAMATSTDQQIADAMKLAKKIQHVKSKKTNRSSGSSNLQTSISNLANNMLQQNTGKMNIISSSGGTMSTDMLPSDMDSSSMQGISVDLQMKAMQEHLQKQPNLVDMYEKAGAKVASTVPEGKLDSRAALRPSQKHERWTYELLVEAPPIAQMVDLIVQGFRSYWEKLMTSMSILDQHQIHWCIIIDNSGSMSIHRNAIYEALVVIMELLRKLESKFAVARFGTRTNQKILKNFDDLFTNQDGQYVLEALTFDEGTYPATGLLRIVDRVFPIDKSGKALDNTIHRLVLMITDGLTQERDDKSYSQTINTYKIDLGFMFIETADQNSSQVLLKGLKQAQSCVLKANNIGELSSTVPQLMNEMIKACLKPSLSSMTTQTTLLPIINIKIPDKKDVSSITEVHQADKHTYTTANPTSYTISNPTASIPNLLQIRTQLLSYLSRPNEYTDYATNTVDQLRQYYHSMKTTLTMQEIEKKWIADEYRFSGLVDDLSTVLGDLVFPLNKFTRRRAALRGSSLYLPGLIKAMTTEWSYKKIFSAKLAGGKREHMMCLVLDISTSMFGTLSIGLMDTIVVLIAALRKINLENFGIIVFGRSVRLIKTNEQGWDAACIYTLMQELRFDRDDDTKDADALEAAIDLLTQCSMRGEKKIFILTDGYSNCGSRLSMVQQRAEDHGIDLIAMAIGIDQTNLKSVYKRYLQCATPYGLPKALRSLFEQDTQLFSLEWPPNTNMNENNTTNIDALKYNLFDDIRSKKVFGEMIRELAGQRELMLVNSGQPPSNMTVDICFCLDCTGSMSRWLMAAKEQMKIIIEGITKLIEKEYPSLKLKLRFAIVGYRDKNDRPQFFTQDFTDNISTVITFLNSLKAEGGDDLPEDVLGALDQCLTLKNWSNTNARFIVLITDAPGHGPELNDNLAIDKYPQGVDGHTLKSICERLLKKDAEVDLMFCCIKPNATAKMQRAFEAYYDAKKDETGKAFTTIKLFDDKQQETQSFHFVFVLDESGSMSSEWHALQNAYLTFLTRRNDDQGGDDHFTVVQFDSSARTICQQQRLINTPRSLTMRGGGTNYCAGLKQASSAIAADRTASSVVMIFMSDGGDGSGGDPTELVRQLKQQFGTNHNFVCHTVGFGSGVAAGSSAARLLANMASVGGGRAYSALTGAELQTVFSNIAANSTTSDALVERFSAILAREISVKIMVDYL